MKKILFFTLLLVLGCASRYFIKDFDIGKTKEATVGSVMISWEEGIKDVNAIYPERTASGLRKELIYAGNSQNTIHVTYREFNIEERGTAMARPAFSQELQYDLSNSKQITFQNLKINVESADQEKIVFSVTEMTGEPPAPAAQNSSRKPMPLMR